MNYGYLSILIMIVLGLSFLIWVIRESKKIGKKEKKKK